MNGNKFNLGQALDRSLSSCFIEAMSASLLTIFLSSFVIALSGALMPGPLLTVTISESSRRGFIAGPLLIAGHAILEMILIIVLILGLAPYFRLPVVFATTAIAGSFVLAWMAYNMFRSLPSLSVTWEGKGRGNVHPVAGGILMSLANPYWLIWWATIGLGYIAYSLQFGIPGIAFFFAGHILADLAWYSAVSVAVDKGRHFLTDRLYRGLIAVCAIFLVVFAGYFLFMGASKLGSLV